METRVVVVACSVMMAAGSYHVRVLVSYDSCDCLTLCDRKHNTYCWTGLTRSRTLIQMITTNLNLESCDVRNSVRCLLFTPKGHCGSFYDEDGVTRLCCPECDPPVEHYMTAEKIEEMQRELAELDED